MQNILVSLLVNIGDVVMMTAALDLIKKKRPQSRLTALVRPEAALILAGNPVVDEILIYPYRSGSPLFGLAALRRRIMKNKYDMFLSLDRRPRGAAAAFLAGVTPRIGPDILYEGSKPKFWTKFLFNRTISLRPTEVSGSQVKMFQLVVRRALNLEGRGEITLPPVTPERASKAADLLGGYRRPLVGFCVKTNNSDKTWPAEGFALIMRKLSAEFGASMFVVGAPGDREYVGRLIEMAKPATALNLAGLTDFLDIPALMDHVDLAVTLDNGAGHLIAASGLKKLVCLLVGTTVDKIIDSMPQAEFKLLSSSSSDSSGVRAEADEVFMTISLILKDT